MREKAAKIYEEFLAAYRIPNAFDSWKEYRQRITDYIIKYTLPGKQIAIFGVGESNDVDLKRLYEHTGNLTLFDNRPDDVKNGLIKYGLQNASDITVKQLDFLGFSDDDYIDLIDIILQDMDNLDPYIPAITAQRLVMCLDEKFKKVFERNDYFGTEKYDYTVMLGVHSQIIAIIQHIWEIFLTAHKLSDNVLEHYTSSLNDELMPRLNDALLKITGISSFIGLELFMNEEGNYVQGAKQAHDDIAMKVASGEISCTSTWMDAWPFKEGQTFRMLVCRVDKI